MAEVRYPVTFVPAGVTVWAHEGNTVLEVARVAGVLISAPCGGRGVCGKCAVKVLEGTPEPPESLEKRGLSVAPPGVRLSCLLRVSGPMTVRPLIAQGGSSSASAADSTDEAVLAAVDLGTTTVEAVLFGEQSGRELGRAAVPNSQQSFGADVLARVALAQSGDGPELTSAAQRSVLEALKAACTRAGACLAGVRRLVVAANSVMAASLLGEDLSAFAAHPFTSPVSEMRTLDAESELAIALPSDSEIMVLPPVASFVGGDATAGILAAGLTEYGSTALYIDVGTNAELAVVTSTGFTLASAAAGPALEASGVTSGGPAAPGGVRRVAFSESTGLSVETIGGGQAQWLTGSGLVSSVGVLLRAGHLNTDGVLSEDGPLSDRFGRVGETLAVQIAGDDSSPVWLSQTDIRSFQSAKAAIAAGVFTLLKTARVKPKAIQRVVVAGALGTALEPSDLVDLGIVPRELSDRIEQIGNASLLGAAMMVTDRDLATESVAALGGAQHVELASEPEFMDRFMSALALTPYSAKSGFPKG